MTQTIAATLKLKGNDKKSTEKLSWKIDYKDHGYASMLLLEIYGQIVDRSKTSGATPENKLVVRLNSTSATLKKLTKSWLIYTSSESGLGDLIEIA